MQQWWGPKGFTVTRSRPWTCVRVASSSIRMDGSDGPPMWGKMVYREITPRDRIVFINSFSDKAGGTTRHPMHQTWPLEMDSIFTFEEQPGGKTRFTVRWSPHNASRKSADLRYQPRQHAQGWGGSLEQLEAYLAKARQG